MILMSKELNERLSREHLESQISGKTTEKSKENNIKQIKRREDKITITLGVDDQLLGAFNNYLIGNITQIREVVLDLDLGFPEDFDFKVKSADVDFDKKTIKVKIELV